MCKLPGWRREESRSTPCLGADDGYRSTIVRRLGCIRPTLPTAWGASDHLRSDGTAGVRSRVRTAYQRHRAHPSTERHVGPARPGRYARDRRVHTRAGPPLVSTMPRQLRVPAPAPAPAMNPAPALRVDGGRTGAAPAAPGGACRLPCLAPPVVGRRRRSAGRPGEPAAFLDAVPAPQAGCRNGACRCPPRVPGIAVPGAGAVAGAGADRRGAGAGLPRR